MFKISDDVEVLLTYKLWIDQTMLQPLILCCQTDLNINNVTKLETDTMYIFLQYTFYFYNYYNTKIVYSSIF